MFGLGQLNFKIKRYEMAEYWFTRAYSTHKDIAYRFWLAMSQFKLYEICALENPRKTKYAQSAIHNFRRCAEDPSCELYARFALFYLAASVY